MEQSITQMVCSNETDMLKCLYSQEGRGRSQTLLKALDVYGLGVAATRNGSMIVAKNNLLLRIDRVKQDSLVWVSLISLPVYVFSWQKKKNEEDSET